MTLFFSAQPTVGLGSYEKFICHRVKILRYYLLLDTGVAWYIIDESIEFKYEILKISESRKNI